MKLADEAITVGSLAKRAGVSIDTIRYYERRGLLAKPARTLAGYRTYSGSTVQRLRFIRNAQALGFTTECSFIGSLSAEELP
jgi:MerR family transcriptional regulator, copper efflux regulator